LDQVSTEPNQAAQTDLRTVENGLKVLWDRVKHASEALSILREEKSVLQAKSEQLESELTLLKSELARKEELVRTLTAAQRDSAAQSALVSNGEREVLAARVKELLAKLNSYL
jgi:hypothetical protein